MSCLPLSCFGGLFQRKKMRELKISGPLEIAAETAQAPRISKLPLELHPSALRSPTASTFHGSGNTGVGLRSPGLRRFGPSTPSFPPPVYNSGTTTPREPLRTRLGPSISVTTPGRSEFRATAPRTPYTPKYFTEVVDDLRLSDEKGSSDYLRLPPTIDFDATPRIHKIFKILSPPPTKLTFTQAVRKPTPSEKPTTPSLTSRISRRLSKRWGGGGSSHKNYNHIPRQPEMQQQYQHQAQGPSESPAATPEAPPVPPLPISSHPLSARNGLGQCLTTRMPNGQTQAVTMVPQLTLSVPANQHPSRNSEPTPIEASPVCDPWRHTTGEIEGLSDRHQAWML
ncbi:hypothetical protein ABW20_dc0102672 [Dactylellina cionopaga]|nr:hypothetical protein ABW20_dc0102672 [Dactylellina cionopaga]